MSVIGQLFAFNHRAKVTTLPYDKEAEFETALVPLAVKMVK